MSHLPAHKATYAVAKTLMSLVRSLWALLDARKSSYDWAIMIKIRRNTTSSWTSWKNDQLCCWRFWVSTKNYIIWLGRAHWFQRVARIWKRHQKVLLGISFPFYKSAVFKWPSCLMMVRSTSVLLSSTNSYCTWFRDKKWSLPKLSKRQSLRQSMQ